MKHSTVVSVCVRVVLGFLAAVPASAAASKIKMQVESPGYPYFRESVNSPMVLVRLDVPNSVRMVELGTLRMVWGNTGFESIDSLHVFYTGDEPVFSDSNRLGSIAVDGPETRHAIRRQLGAGIHFFWVSAKLKGKAHPDFGIELNFVGFKFQTGVESGEIAWSDRLRIRVGSILAQAGQNGVHTYRIPGIASTDKGTLIAVYDFRYRSASDLPGDIDVGMRRSTDGGKTWEKQRVIMDMGEPHEQNGIGDPAILFDSVTKTIWVAAIWTKGDRAIAGSEPGWSPDSSGQIILVNSKDDGLTWSKPYNITSQVKDPRWHIYFCGPGSGICMKDGTLVFASQYWDESEKPGIPHSSIIYSRDQGKTWVSGRGVRSNTNEAQVIETTPGTLMINMRDNRGGFRSVATTSNLGKSWSLHSNSYKVFKDPICMASFAKMYLKVNGQVKPLVMFSNVNDSQSRVNMTIKASLDLGETWHQKNSLLIDNRRSYGYSCLVRINDDTVGILYEGRGDIYFVRIPVMDIIR